MRLQRVVIHYEPSKFLQKIVHLILLSHVSYGLYMIVYSTNFTLTGSSEEFVVKLIDIGLNS